MDDAIKTLLEKLANEWAPAALQLGVQMEWYDSLYHIISGILTIIICIASGYATYKLCMYINTLVESGDDDNQARAVWLVTITALLGIVFIASFMAVFLADGALNAWNWIGLVDPKVKLAHDIYTAALAALKK